MAEISFYILPTQSQQERLLFACKLIEKAYRSGCFCYVLTDTAGQSQQIDNLLWTFRAGSFIPHQLYTGDIPATEQVLIGSLPAPAQWQKTVINLSSQCANAERVLEILDNSEATKAVGRDRYRHYKEAGHNLTTHKM
ncbi:MAG: DNA polymerase III subunit chi [Methylococcaceae bacterium NSP1-2]|jgi:DNA polymerase-3 subunit chi|nr:DNA polymerase III subunit chi [Methylococcaceae bacterium]OYV20777.1 MAG: DNA polymerase III subunit chi [Methylococcaceae bacterium NSP1-2]